MSSEEPIQSVRYNIYGNLVFVRRQITIPVSGANPSSAAKPYSSSTLADIVTAAAERDGSEARVLFVQQQPASFRGTWLSGDRQED